jgi:hypothetical protein
MNDMIWKMGNHGDKLVEKGGGWGFGALEYIGVEGREVFVGGVSEKGKKK